MAELQNIHHHYLCVGIEDEFHKFLKEAANHTDCKEDCVKDLERECIYNNDEATFAGRKELP